MSSVEEIFQTRKRKDRAHFMIVKLKIFKYICPVYFLLPLSLLGFVLKFVLELDDLDRVKIMKAKEYISANMKGIELVNFETKNKIVKVKFF